mgnify:CR=1 FL=1
MRCMDRNKSECWYLLYDGKTMNVSDDGYETGQMSVKYKDAVKMLAISPLHPVRRRWSSSDNLCLMTRLLSRMT